MVAVTFTVSSSPESISTMSGIFAISISTQPESTLAKITPAGMLATALNVRQADSDYRFKVFREESNGSVGNHARGASRLQTSGRCIDAR